MQTTDLINGSFEIVGGFVGMLNILRLMKDKRVMGVNWLVTLFFTLWGIWNCYFYPVNGFILSFIGGIFLCLTNIIWLLLLFKYSKSSTMEKKDYTVSQEWWNTCGDFEKMLLVDVYYLGRHWTTLTNSEIERIHYFETRKQI